MEPDAFEALVLSQLSFIQQKSQEFSRGCPEDAEDLAQEVLEKAIQRAHLFAGSDIRGWLYVMTRRVFLDKVKAASRRPVSDSLDELLEDSAEPTKMSVQSAELDALDGIFSPATVAAFRLLEPHRQRALYLAYVDDLSMAEVALRLSVPVGTVKRWLFEARAQMRDGLAAA